MIRKIIDWIIDLFTHPVEISPERMGRYLKDMRERIKADKERKDAK